LIQGYRSDKSAANAWTQCRLWLAPSEAPERQSMVGKRT